MKKIAVMIFIASLAVYSCVSPPKEIAEAYFSLANSYYDDGDYDKAIEYYLKAQKYETNKERLYYNLAMAYIHTARYTEAEKLLKKLEEKDKNNIKVLTTLGYLEASKKDYKKAEEYYMRAIEISPYDEKLYHNMAVLLLEEEQDDKALQYSQKAYDIKPEDKKIKSLYAYLKLKNEPDNEDALKLAEEAVESDKSNIRLISLMATVYEKKEKYADAISSLNLIISAEPDNADALFNRARIHLLYTGENSQGLSDLKAALEKGYNNKEELQNLIDSPLLLAKKEAEETISSATSQSK